MSQIVEVLGQFAVTIEGEVKLFATEAEAVAADTEATHGAKNRALAAEYTDSLDLGSKNAAGKANIIVAFLNWVDSRAEEAPVADSPDFL